MTRLLGIKLKEYRQRKFPNLGLRTVAETIGVSFAHLSRIERGLPPSPAMLKKLTLEYNLNDEEKFELVRYSSEPASYPEIANYLNEYLQQNPDLIKGLYFRTAKFKNDNNDKDKN